MMQTDFDLRLQSMLVVFKLAAFPSKAAVMPIPERIFASNNFWYTPIPIDAPLHTNSANFTADFLRQKQAHYGTVSINTKAYSCAVYVVGPGVKTVLVQEWNCQNKT